MLLLIYNYYKFKFNFLYYNYIMNLEENLIELKYIDPKINFNSKTVMLWAFDEVIDSDTDFEGNHKYSAKYELINIIKFIQKNELYYEQIDESLVCEYLKILDKLDAEIESKDIIIKDSDYFLCGWLKHGISIFYEKEVSGNYILGIINAGEGIEYQGIVNEYCNGIMIFNNITKDTLTNFLKKYQKFYISIDKKNSYESYRYFIFYIIIVKELLNMQNYNTVILNDYYVNFNQLLLLGKVQFIKINKQNLGSCTFTNTINYIVYMLYKQNPESIENNLKIFQDWYYYCKILIKLNIYNLDKSIFFNKTI